MELILAATLLAIVIAAFLYVQIKSAEQAAKERADLLDRIMSKSLTEYKEQTSEPVRYAPVSLTDEEEWGREIEQMKTG